MFFKKLSKNRITLFASLALSLLGVGVMGVSTFAWFQIEANDVDPISGGDITAGSSNLVVDTVTGYKYEYDDLDTNSIDYSSGQVSSYTPVGTQEDNNDDLDEEMVDFDIPTGGDGYYLLGDSTFAGKHGTQDSSYDWKFPTSVKFKEINNSELDVYHINGISFDVNEQVRIKHHGFGDGSVVSNTWISVTVDSNSSSYAQIAGNNIKIKTAGTYNLWYDAATNKVGLELSQAASVYNRSIKKNHSNKTTRASDLTSKAYTKIVLNNSGCDWWYRSLWIESINLATDYTLDHLEAFISANYGTEETGDWNKSSTTKSWKRSGDGFNLCAGGSGTSLTFYLPDWLNYCKVYLLSSKPDNGNDKVADIYMNYLNNLYSDAGKSRRWDNAGVEKHGSAGTNGKGKTVTFTARYESGTYQGYNNWQSIVYSTSTASNGSNASWGNKTVYKQTVLSDGTAYSGTGSYTSTTHDTVECYDLVTIPGSHPTPDSGYIWIGWKYSTSSTYSANTSSDVTEGGKVQVLNTTYLYAVYKQQWSITIKPSYFITNDNNTQTRLTSLSGNPNADQTVYVDPGNGIAATSWSNAEYRDNTNGIWYTFTRFNNSPSGTGTAIQNASSSVYFTTAACTTVYSGNPSSNLTVYVKMVCPKLVTFYIDISTCTGGAASWTDCYIYGEASYYNMSNMSTTNGLHAKPIIGSKLYRASVPNNVTKVIPFNGSTGTSNQTGDLSDVASASNHYLFTKGENSSNNRYAAWNGDISETGAKLYIKRASGGDIEEKDMGYGGDVYNKFVYEQGLLLYAGDAFVIKNPTGAYISATNGQTSTTELLNSTTTATIGGSDRTLNVIKETSRYTIYLDNNSKVALADVPILGNGYYIMKNTGRTYGYRNCVKMHALSGTNLKNIAVYKNFTIDASDVSASRNQIYIRSYLDSVDHLFTNGSLDGGVEYSSGKVTLSAGTYNIYLYDSSGANFNSDSPNFTNIKIAISTVSNATASFFKLNSLDTTSGSDSIKDQNTSMVVEITVHTTNLMQSKISAVVTNGITGVGTNATASATRITDCYNVFRDSDHTSFYNGLGTGNQTFSNLVTMDANNSLKKYYVYILIDYTTKTSLTRGLSGSISIMLKAAQVS